MRLQCRLLCGCIMTRDVDEERVTRNPDQLTVVTRVYNKRDSSQSNLQNMGAEFLKITPDPKIPCEEHFRKNMQADRQDAVTYLKEVIHEKVQFLGAKEKNDLRKLLV